MFDAYNYIISILCNIFEVKQDFYYETINLSHEYFE